MGTGFGPPWRYIVQVEREYDVDILLEMLKNFENIVIFSFIGVVVLVCVGVVIVLLGVGVQRVFTSGHILCCDQA